MIYGYDQAVQFPVRDLYDSGIMLMSIAAAKDMYDRALNKLDEIYKFQDFYSPISKDVDYVYNLTVGAAKAKIDDLYARGIDPLRSAEGRAAIAQLKRGINYAEIAKRKENAKNAELYQQAKSKLIAAGKWNPRYEEFLLGGKTLENWDTSVDGMWTRTSPGEYSDLNTNTKHWFDNINRNAYLKTEGGYDYFGVDPKDMASILDSNMPDFVNSDYGRYLLELARQQLGPDATNEQALDQLKNNILYANKEMLLSPTRQINPEHQLNLQLKKQVEADKIKSANDFVYAMRQAGADEDGNGVIDQNELARYAARVNAREDAKAYRTGSGSRSTGLVSMQDVFKYGEATQEAGIGRFVLNTIGTVDKLKRNADGSLMSDSKGRPVVETDAKGNPIKISVQDASIDEVMHAYYKYGFDRYKKYIKKLLDKYKNTFNEDDPTSGLAGSNAFNEFLNTFGFNDTEVGWQSSVGKKLESDGTVKYSAGDFNNVYTDAELLMMAKGYAKRNENSLNHEDEMRRAISVNLGQNLGKSDMLIIKGLSGGGKMEAIKPGVNSPNKIPLILKDGRMLMFRAININFGDRTKALNTGRLWIPVGSPSLPPAMGKNESGKTTLKLVPYTDNMDSMSQIEEDALYSKAIGKQGDSAIE